MGRGGGRSHGLRQKPRRRYHVSADMRAGRDSGGPGASALRGRGAGGEQREVIAAAASLGSHPPPKGPCMVPVRGARARFSPLTAIITAMEKSCPNTIKVQTTVRAKALDGGSIPLLA